MLKLRTNKLKYDLVWVEWDDAASSSGWEEVSDEVEESLAVTVGFLIKETDNHILLAASVDDENNHTNNRQQIPKGMIKKMYLIRKAFSAKGVTKNDEMVQG